MRRPVGKAWPSSTRQMLSHANSGVCRRKNALFQAQSAPDSRACPAVPLAKAWHGASCAAHRGCAGISHSARMLGACHPQPTQADHACLCPDAPRPFGRPCPSCRCLQLAGKRPTALPGTSHSAWRAARDAPPGVGDAVGRAAPFAAPRAPLPYRLMAVRIGHGRLGRLGRLSPRRTGAA